MSESEIRERYRSRLVHMVAGFLIGLFQLVGRSHVGQFIGSGDAAWYFELRLWALAALSLWLMGIAVARGPGAERFFAGRVRTWATMIISFVAYMMVTSLWAPDVTLAALKAYDLLFVAWSCALTISALRLCGIADTIDGFWSAIFGLGLVLAVAGLLSALSGDSMGRVSALGGGPNVFGRNMGLLTLAALRLTFDSRRWVRSPALVAVPIATLLVLLSGSRGAMIALFAGGIIYLGIRGIDRRVRLSIVLAGIVGVAAVSTPVGQRAVSTFLDRFVRLLLVEGYTSNRVVLVTDGIAAGIRNPIGGMGLSGFVQVDSFGTYPHNVFVEAFAEGGLLGLVLLCVPFIVYVRRWARGRGLGDPAIVAGLFLLAISSSISGDLFDARGVFLLLLMAVASQRPARAAHPKSVGGNATIPAERA